LKRPSGLAEPPGPRSRTGLDELRLRAADASGAVEPGSDLGEGINKTFQQKGDRGRMLGESDEFRRLRHAVEKAAGDRERAIKNVCRLYGTNRLDALPPGIRATALALLDRHV
jgi:hypothetical protein